MLDPAACHAFFFRINSEFNGYPAPLADTAVNMDLSVVGLGPAHDIGKADAFRLLREVESLAIVTNVQDHAVARLGQGNPDHLWRIFDDVVELFLDDPVYIDLKPLRQ